MAVERAGHGQVVDLNSFPATKSTAIVKTERFEVIRVIVEEAKRLPPHKVEGPITVQCLSGQCTFFVDDEPRRLSPGAWLYLDGGTMHAVEATETTALLVTIMFGDGRS